MPSESVSVVYLSYVPYGPGLLETFLRSYQARVPGKVHDLIIVFKGQKEKGVAGFQEIIDRLKVSCKILFYEGEGFDIDTYFWIANNINADHCLFFNSRSEILADQWLAHYCNAMQSGSRVVSATASYQSLYSHVFQNNKWNWDHKKGFGRNFKKYKLLIKALLYWRFLFRPFPNPHLRTNAFFIERDLLLSIKKPQMKNKFDAYRFESGRRSFSEQLKKKGCSLVLLAKNGQTFQPDQWRSTRIFWKGDQEDLLIADNQTEMYRLAGDAEKKHLTRMAWGDNA